MSTDLRAIMRRDERRRRMLNDPDLTGDTLLFALALDEVLTTREEQNRRSFRRWTDDVEELARGNASDRAARGYWVKHIISDDVPRYEPVREWKATPCAAPMIRREGPCGKRATTVLIDRDPDTGKAHWTGFCTRHKEMQAQFDARREAWIANGKPSPPPNAGGVLCRYFATDWDEMYRWAAPWREPLEGAREATPPRPMLRLIQGGNDSEVADA